MRSCCRYRLAGKPVQALVRFSTNATGRSRPFSIRSLNNTTQISCQRWKCRITTEELGVLGNRISRRVAKFLERRGFLERDEDNSYLTLETSEDEAMQQLYGHSITSATAPALLYLRDAGPLLPRACYHAPASMQSYRIAIGPQQGRKVFTLQSLPPVAEPKAGSSRVANVAGFSLHAGVMAEAHQRDKLDRSGGVPLCQYIARPAVSEKRLSLLEDGRIRYELKTPYRDGTTHVAAPAHPAPAALVRPCTSSSSRWTSWLGLLRWFRNPGSTSPGSTVCLHLTANIGYRSRLPNEERVASATQKRKGNANHRQSGGHQ